MLVDVFYGYEETLRVKEEEIDKEELERIAEGGEDDQVIPPPVDPKAKDQKKPEEAGLESGTPRSEEEVDPNALDLNPDNVVDALNAFEEFRKAKAIEEALSGTKVKKNTQETEE